jgi:ribosomal protein L11 methyltransferase
VADAFLTLSFDLDGLDAGRAEAACLAQGASAVTFLDGGDQPVLEPAPGELRLWPATRVQCLFAPPARAESLVHSLARELAIAPERIATETLPERAWEREWLKDFHARRFGRRLWVCPRHERVSAPQAVVVTLDPGLAFGTGTHPSTALCLEWLDGHLAPGAVVIDYGCGSGVLALAAAALGARAVHCFDIDPQALLATAENAEINGVGARVQVHASAAALPDQADVLLANILAAPLASLASRFAALLRAQGVAVLSGLMRHEAADVTAAYGACFDVVPFGECEEWTCLAARRR